MVREFSIAAKNTPFSACPRKEITNTTTTSAQSQFPTVLLLVKMRPVPLVLVTGPRKQRKLMYPGATQIHSTCTHPYARQAVVSPSRCLSKLFSRFFSCGTLHSFTFALCHGSAVRGTAINVRLSGSSLCHKVDYIVRRKPVYLLLQFSSSSRYYCKWNIFIALA